MKHTRQIKLSLRASKPRPALLPIFDEASALLGVPRAMVAQAQAWRRPNARSMIATQAIMKFNSGKRMRFLSSTRWNDGSPVKPVPRKFIPAQAVRRAVLANTI